MHHGGGGGGGGVYSPSMGHVSTNNDHFGEVKKQECKI